MYFITDMAIYNFDPDLPVSATNPVLNTVGIPPSSYGLAVGRNFFAATPAFTFYTMVFGKLYYHNGTSWVNTNHDMGQGYNLGAGGGYLFNYSVDGGVWRYDGTGDATYITYIGGGFVADLSVDCSGNFYVLVNSSPQALKKYNSAGVLINTYSVTGLPLGTGGGGLAIFGDEVYADDTNFFLHGTFTGNNLHFTSSSMPLSYIADAANCPGLAAPVQVNVSVCNSQLPYPWNGNSYATPGSYTISLPGSQGCDSLVTLNLQIGGIATGPPQNISVCTAQLPYSWNGNSYTSAGTYTVTLPGSGNCDSIATLNLSVTSAVNGIPQNVTICPASFPYSWNGNSYSLPGTYNSTLTASNGCDSIATLVLSLGNAVTGPQQNVSICANLLPYNWNGNSYPSPGVYSITLTASNGCDSIATLNLALSDAINGAPENITLCQDQLPYIWNGNSYSSAGTYTSTLTAANGCDSIATLQLAIITIVNGPPQLVNVCPGQLPYYWNGNNYSLAGTYTLTLVGSNGCDSVATLVLSLLNNITGTPQLVSVCPSLLPYNWNGNSYSSAGTYTANLTAANGCDSVASLVLTVLNTVTGPPQNINVCSNELPYFWNGNTYNSAGTYTATLVSGSGCDSIVQLNLYIIQPSTATVDTIICPDKLPFNWNGNSYNSGGSYQVLLTAINGCDSMVTLNLGIYPAPVVSAGFDATVEPNTAYQLNGTGGAYYEWFPAALLNDPHLANPVAVVSNSTEFQLLVTDSNGCTGTDRVSLKVIRTPEIYVPTSFSPNGDALNPLFRPLCRNIALLHYFRVYNKYGELLYQTNQFEAGWDGTFKGAAQNTGAYVWMLDATDMYGARWVRKGYVVLLR